LFLNLLKHVNFDKQFKKLSDIEKGIQCPWFAGCSRRSVWRGFAHLWL